MSNYIGLQTFLEEVASELGYQYIPKNDDSAYYTTVYLRRISENFVLIWKIENDLLFSEEIQDGDIEKLKTLFYNGVWFKNESEISSIEYVQNFISDNIINEGPDTRILSILEYVYKKTAFAGQRTDIELRATSLKDQYWRKLFFHRVDEFDFYINAAAELNYLEILATSDDCYHGVRLTIPGLKAIVDIAKERSSKTCFVAMFFDGEMFKVYDNAIRPAIIESGFEPLIINEKNDIPSDMTINDAILAGIKKSKFTIADFTQHRNGVYFEAGYALGRGHKVIYTCREDDMTDAHFDTRNYPHIVWKDAEDLKKKLMDKIEVFIKS